MKYVPIPVALLEVGKPLPVDVWSPAGQLLLRRGQPVVSAQHRDRLSAHEAASTPGDAMAWQRSYERMVHQMLREGVDVDVIARAPMPSEIRQSDYVEGDPVAGGWLDLQDRLRGVLHQGGLVINPLERIEGIRQRALALLRQDADDSLFCLFQALADESLGYCATHALLCAVVGDLTAQKMGLNDLARASLAGAALTMNIGMAREQDSLARQRSAPNDWQRQLIQVHPEKSVQLLSAIGVDDPDWLDLVRWHRDPGPTQVHPDTVMMRQILSMADALVAKMAGRKSRSSLAPMHAIKSLVVGAQGDAMALGSAMALAAGFYPPGSYVRLVNGDTAVSVQRGLKANTPWVIGIADAHGVARVRYLCLDTAQSALAIQAPVHFESVRVSVSADKVRRARARIPGASPPAI